MVEHWIHDHADIVSRSSAEIRFDRMPLQSPPDLAGVFRPHDPSRIGDWSSLTLIYAYVHALKTHGRILDIGSGDGWPALPLAPYMQQVVGIDSSPRRTQVANENLRRFGYDHVTFRTARGEALPFRDRHFDGIVVGTAVEQAEDRKALLAEAFRVLSPGGRFVATFENVLAARHAVVPSPAVSGGPEETAAFFVADNGDLVCRYVVLSLQTLCETEYRVAFRGEGLSSSFDPNTVRLESQSANPFAELPGASERTSAPGEQAPLDTAILDQLFASPSRESIVAEACTIRHFTPETFAETLAGIGFVDISVHGRVSLAVGRVIEDLATRGILEELADRFHPICASLARQWPLIEPEGDQAPFVVARRPLLDRSAETLSKKARLARGGATDAADVR